MTKLKQNLWELLPIIKVRQRQDVFLLLDDHGFAGVHPIDDILGPVIPAELHMGGSSGRHGSLCASSGVAWSL
jgi:hypothetical protein